MQMLTIRQMLTMRTCHDMNAYKIGGSPDWLGSFFTVTPDHVPGTNFSYDTASTHTLGALVEKLTGMELLDYLRTKFLDELYPPEERDELLKKKHEYDNNLRRERSLSASYAAKRAEREIFMKKKSGRRLY